MFEEISSSDTGSLDRIKEKRVFERITAHSGQILRALEEDPKKEVYNTVQPLVETKSSKLSAQDLETSIRINVHSTEVKPDSSITVGKEGSEDTSVNNTVSEETYDRLKSLTLDFDVIDKDVEYQLNKRQSF